MTPTPSSRFGHARVALGRWAPGETTAPLLIATSAWLFNTAREARH